MVIDIIIMHDFDFNFYSSCCFLLFANYMALAGTACCTSASGLLGGIYNETSHTCPCRTSSVSEIAPSPRLYYAKINVACPFVHDCFLL